MKIFRSVYQRVLRGATHRQAPLLLVALSFFEGFIVPVPPEVLLAPMALANRACVLWYATLSLLGSLAGACVGYALGHLAFSALQPLLQSLGWSAAMNAQILDLQQRAHHSPWQAFALLVCAGFTPIPLKIFTWASGAVGIPIFAFLTSMLIGRAKRVYCVAGALVLGGARAEKMLLRWIEPIGWIVTTILLVLVVWLIGKTRL